jgi:LmbE family N-acetylglucosaminyl deacetylase
MEDEFKQAILVVAHPDDEILWFSSLVTKARRIVICYLGQPSKPKWTVGRQQALAQYPLKDIYALGLDAAEVFGLGDWYTPGTDEFGMVLNQTGERQRRYRDNYYRLIEELPHLLTGAPVVITHNPWGEYGHEEHVQVFRAVQFLQQSLGYALRVSNYVSRRSLALMIQAMPSTGASSQTLPTDIESALAIRDLYIQNDCWTWKKDYRWPERETILEINQYPVEGNGRWNSLPFNFLNIGEAVSPPRLVRAAERITRIINASRKLS